MIIPVAMAVTGSGKRRAWLPQRLFRVSVGLYWARVTVRPFWPRITLPRRLSRHLTRIRRRA
ncbi:hypothetical protein KLEP181_gp06 [Paracoccus phage vB_PmaP_KLEP18-1]|nr:hypothetical protein KLEP181_gp06 [Paracoccus phage vB_PmaP_KLEP18-1]